MTKKPNSNNILSIENYRKIWNVGFLFCLFCEEENVYMWKNTDKHLPCKKCQHKIDLPKK